MALTFQQIKQLSEGKALDARDMLQVTYEELLMFARAMELIKYDPQLSEAQIEHCYQCLMAGMTITCSASGIDIKGFGSMEDTHLSDTFLAPADVLMIEMSNSQYQLTRKEKSGSRGGFYMGSSGNNNNNNNNNS